MKVAAAVKDGVIAPALNESTEVMIVTEENGQPVSKEVISLDGAGITSVLFKLSMQNIDVMLAKRKMSVTELSEKVGITMANISILKNGKAKAIRMIGMQVLPGCQGDAVECIAGLLAGEQVGDPSKIVIPEEDEDDPMHCMHDCAKCMADCGDRPEGKH